jgi:uncharacterized membrane protein YcjF (UPF0283 family)
VKNHTIRPGPVTERASPIDEMTSDPGPKAEHRDAESTRPSPGPVEESAIPLEPDSEIGPSTDPPNAAKESANAHWHYAFWILTASVGAWLGYRVAVELIALWQRGNLLALPFTLLALALLSVFVWALLREFKAKRRVETLNHYQTEIHLALEHDSLVEIKDALAPRLAAFEHRHSALIHEFHDAAITVDSARDYGDLFTNMILARLDDEADDVIKRNTVTVAAAVAIVPHPALDVFVILWKASTLIRDLGNIYGLELTTLSSMRLLKHALTSAILAVGADAIGDIALEQIGSGFLAKVGKAGGQSAIIAVRIYRLGQMTKQLCRPRIPSA